MKRKKWSRVIPTVCLTVCLAVCLTTAGSAGGEGAAAKETAAPLVPALELPQAERGAVEEIPLDQDSLQEAISPREEGYLFDGGSEEATGYADPSITVNIGRGRIYETNYIYARVRIASASQLRTLLASPLGKQGTTPGHDLAKRVQAVIAINGDFPGGDGVTTRTRGAIMRQGQMLRLKCDGQMDVLVIDRAGDLRILKNAEDAEIEAVREEAAQIFTFGPALVVDGEPNYDFRDHGIGAGKPAQRMALCQTGPLEYLLITCEGPEDADSRGLTITQFTDLVSSIPEVRTAYNLDGGSSSTMVFRKEGKNWRKINAPTNPKIRPLKDIIYFATAYAPER